MLYAGLEMGGTKTIAVLGVPGDIRERLEFPTTTPEETLGQAARILDRWQREGALAGLGIASFGPVRLDPLATDYGTILNTPKPGWRGTRVVAALAEAFAGPIALDTDVSAGAVAEHRLGAARGCATMVYLTIGTGVGGGILVNGKPLHGALHPEVGHMRLHRDREDPFPGSCAYHRDCVEGLVSGTALTARFGCSPADVAASDPRWQLVAGDLAELLANLLLVISPQRIVVGGGVIMKQPHLLPAAIAALPERLGGYLGDVDARSLAVRIVKPQLGNDAGPQGSLCLAEAAAHSSVTDR